MCEAHTKMQKLLVAPIANMVGGKMSILIQAALDSLCWVIMSMVYTGAEAGLKEVCARGQL